MHIDITLKELIPDAPVFASMLLGREVRKVPKPEHIEINDHHRRGPDLVFVDKRRGRANHLELQSTNDASMGLRMAEYDIDLTRALPKGMWIDHLCLYTGLEN